MHVPTYYHPHHHHHDNDDLDTYDYAHPHIQYRKDIEELKEWGIEPYEDPDEAHNEHVGHNTVPVHPPGVLPAPFPPSAYPGGYGVPQYAPNIPQIPPSFQEKRPPITAHNLAYSAYADNNRRVVVQQPNAALNTNVPLNPGNLVPSAVPVAANTKNSYAVFAQPNSRQISKGVQVETKTPVVTQKQPQDDEYYGPIVGRLEDIFKQLRFFEETCRERLVCSMYKNPTVYSPHSNLVSNELSR